MAHRPDALRFLVLLAFLTPSLVACAAMRSAPEPMEAARFGPEMLTADEGLIVLLPGFGDRPSKFEQQGFIAALAETGIRARVVAVDAHFGYYRAGTVVERIYEDIIAPEVERGVAFVWVVGVSMGGSGALGVAEAHPGLVDRVWLLAPYLGPQSLVTEVRDAGGLARWQPSELGPNASDRDRFFQRLWVWLSGYAHGEARPELRIGIGDRDSGLRASEQVAAALPTGASVVRPGGHDWSVWTPLFETFLAEALISAPSVGPP